MERIEKLITDSQVEVRLYLLKKVGRKGKYEAVVFPNDLDKAIKENYANNFRNFCGEREIVDYDCLHSEKGAIKKLPLTDLNYWDNLFSAISEADEKKARLTKKNFTDNYSVIVISYQKKSNDKPNSRCFLIAQYRKIDSWYKRSLKYVIVGDKFKDSQDDIFVLNGCIDTAIIEDDVFILQENQFEKIFNFFEKAKQTVREKETEIAQWQFLDNASAFYTDVCKGKKTTRKLARALEKLALDFSKLDPEMVHNTLSNYDEFKSLCYDKQLRIKYISGDCVCRNLILDILCHAYARNIFSDDLVKTKGV